MPEVTITYCVPRRYQFKALQDADTILRELGERLTALHLIPGDHGIYDVAMDGEVLFSLDKVGRFPESRDLVELVSARVPMPRRSQAKRSDGKA